MTPALISGFRDRLLLIVNSLIRFEKLRSSPEENLGKHLPRGMFPDNPQEGHAVLHTSLDKVPFIEVEDKKQTSTLGVQS